MNPLFPAFATSSYRALLVVVSFMWLMLPLTANVISATVELDRKETHVGGHAYLNLSVTGGNDASVSVPKVDGLLIEHQGQSTQMQIINGNFRSQVSVIFLITPNKRGEFVIPPFVIESQGKKIKTKEVLSLKVTADPPLGQVNLNAMEKAGDIAFLEVIGLKDLAVVGELIPVEIRVYYKSSTQISNCSRPKLEGSSFMLKPLEEKPREGTINIEGIPYSAIVFKASISPIKAGKFDLSFNVGVTLHIEDSGAKGPKARNRRSAFGGFLGSSFTRRIKKEAKLISKVKTIEVIPPPTENQPDKFDGTIGTFSVSASASDSTVRSGDPITLQVTVSGQGDFDRVPMPHFSDPSGWKTYPGKHQIKKSNTSQSDGIKIFEQVIVPKNESITEIPPLELIYSDPAKQRYETARTEAIPIKVTPGTDIKDEVLSATKPSSSSESTAVQKNNVPNQHLGWLRSQRIDNTPWFLASLAGLASMMAVFLIMLWQRRYNNAERQAKAMIQKEIQSALDAMKEAIQDKHAPRFFAAARQALQIEWGQQRHVAPEAVTGTDLPNAKAREIFDMADAMEFSGENPNLHDLNHWKQHTLEALESLKSTLNQPS